MLQELQKNGNITSGMQQLTMQDTPAISKPALATIGHQQEPAPLYAPGCAEKEGSSVDKSSGKSVPLVNRLSPRMPPTPTEQRGKRLTLAPTSQAVLSGSGQHDAHVHPSSAVTSPNAMTLQGLQSEHPEKALCRKKMSNERIKPADPNSAQGEEGQRTGTRSVEPSVNDANSRYIPYLTTEENWDDECEPFPKFYVGNFKPAKFIFSSSYIGEERREQSKSSGVPERSEPASQRQASGHTNQSSRGQKQRATRPACEKGKCTCVLSHVDISHGKFQSLCPRTEVSHAQLTSGVWLSVTRIPLCIICCLECIVVV